MRLPPLRDCGLESVRLCTSAELVVAGRALPAEHVDIRPAVGGEPLEQRVERVGHAAFEELAAGDVLFIDSSHMIRPQGDVLFEYLQLLPTLRPGVIVHVHDIFSPRDYLERWLRDSGVFWNEQYLLESFLSNNREWKIIGAVNLLAHDHFERLRTAAPFLGRDAEPGSFYIQKIA